MRGTQKQDLDPVARSEPVASGLHGTLGFRLTEWDGYAVVEMEIGTHHLNRTGIVHGGVYAALLDTSLGYTGVFTGTQEIRRAISLSLTTHFTGQVRAVLLRTVAQRRSSGRRIFVASGEVVSEDGTVVALGQGTFRLRSDSPERT